MSTPQLFADSHHGDLESALGFKYPHGCMPVNLTVAGPMQQEWQGFSSFTRWMNDGEHCGGPWASAWGNLIGNDSCLKV